LKENIKGSYFLFKLNQLAIWYWTY